MLSNTASSEGVQNDFLPLLDGCEVSVKDANSSTININTKNILFIALGAFSKNKYTDLIPEIQGRFPIICKANSLSADDYYYILKHSKLSIINQIKQIIKGEGIVLEFTNTALEEIANITHQLNLYNFDTGARRMFNVVNSITEDISFNAPEIYEMYKKDNKSIVLTIDKDYVDSKRNQIFKETINHKKYVI